MVGAIEVLDTFGMLLAKLFRQAILILILEVKAGAGKDWVFLHNFVQDVDVEGQTLGTLQLLDQFTADGASDAVFVVQLLNTAGAESVPTVDQYARDALAHVILEGAELAYVQAARLVVQVHQIDSHIKSASS